MKRGYGICDMSAAATTSTTPKKKSPLPGVYVTKPLAWVVKYLVRAKRIMPALKLPRRLLSYRPHLGTEHRTWGSCSVTDRTITIATHKPEIAIVKVKIKSRVTEKKKKVLVPLSHREILMTLSHELAHLEYHEHGYEQKWYALTIFNTFGLFDVCATCHGKGRIPARYENE